MQNISVTRYANPKHVGWAGYLQPEDRAWICYIGLDGRPLFFLHRDPETGAVLPDDPDERAAHLAKYAGRPGAFIGTAMQSDDGAMRAGEVVIPLGISGGGGDVEPWPEK